METIAIVQARMSSQRLPGKVLHEVAGRPMLQYLLERLEHCTLLNDIVVATSSEKSDDAIEIFCKNHNVSCHRGSLSDVAGRFRAVLEACPYDAFVRVNGDSPLLDQRLIEKGIGFFLEGNFDLVTNTLVRTYPKGQSVEILSAATFKKVCEKMREPEDLEHVTRYFYRNKDRFKIFNFESEKELGRIQLSVDTKQDMELFENVIGKMKSPHWEYNLKNILDFYNEISE